MIIATNITNRYRAEYIGSCDVVGAFFLQRPICYHILSLGYIFRQIGIESSTRSLLWIFALMLFSSINHLMTSRTALISATWLTLFLDINVACPDTVIGLPGSIVKGAIGDCSNSNPSAS